MELQKQVCINYVKIDGARVFINENVCVFSYHFFPKKFTMLSRRYEAVSSVLLIIFVPDTKLI